MRITGACWIKILLHVLVIATCLWPSTSSADIGSPCQFLADEKFGGATYPGPGSILMDSNTRKRIDALARSDSPVATRLERGFKYFGGREADDATIVWPEVPCDRKCTGVIVLSITGWKIMEYHFEHFSYGKTVYYTRSNDNSDIRSNNAKRHRIHRIDPRIAKISPGTSVGGLPFSIYWLKNVEPAAKASPPKPIISLLTTTEKDSFGEGDFGDVNACLVEER